MTAQMLVYSEHRELLGELIDGARGLAAALGLEVAAAVLDDAEPAGAERWVRRGARCVYVPANSHGDDLDTERVAEALSQIANRGFVCIVLIGSTRRGKALAGRLAQKLDAGCITDAIALSVADGGLVAQRHALGGKTIATEVLTGPRQVVAVKRGALAGGSPGSHKPEAQARERHASPETNGQVVPVKLSLDPPRVKTLQRRAKQAERVDLESAEAVVAVGRGLQNQEDLALVQSLADALGAELGCTRSLCSEYGWLSEQRMIGISGKSCRPRLLISVGASGQIQHAVGIMGSQLIVAINRDESAPIFEIADYGIVGDLYEVVPKLIDALRTRK